MIIILLADFSVYCALRGSNFRDYSVAIDDTLLHESASYIVTEADLRYVTPDGHHIR